MKILEQILNNIKTANLVENDKQKSVFIEPRNNNLDDDGFMSLQWFSLNKKANHEIIKKITNDYISFFKKNMLNQQYELLQEVYNLSLKERNSDEKLIYTIGLVTIKPNWYSNENKYFGVVGLLESTNHPVVFIPFENEILLLNENKQYSSVGALINTEFNSLISLPKAHYFLMKSNKKLSEVASNSFVKCIQDDFTTRYELDKPIKMLALFLSTKHNEKMKYKSFKSRTLDNSAYIHDGEYRKAYKRLKKLHKLNFLQDVSARIETQFDELGCKNNQIKISLSIELNKQMVLEKYLFDNQVSFEHSYFSSLSDNELKKIIHNYPLEKTNLSFYINVLNETKNIDDCIIEIKTSNSININKCEKDDDFLNELTKACMRYTHIPEWYLANLELAVIKYQLLFQSKGANPTLESLLAKIKNTPLFKDNILQNNTLKGYSVGYFTVDNKKNIGVFMNAEFNCVQHYKPLQDIFRKEMKKYIDLNKVFVCTNDNTVVRIIINSPSNELKKLIEFENEITL